MTLLQNIFSLVFVFSFSDNDFREKLIRNVKKEVGLVIGRRLFANWIHMLFVAAWNRQRSSDLFILLHFSFFFLKFSQFIFYNGKL